MDLRSPLVLVSGGPDSVALLRAIVALSGDLRCCTWTMVCVARNPAGRRVRPRALSAAGGGLRGAASQLRWRFRLSRAGA